MMRKVPTMAWSLVYNFTTCVKTGTASVLAYEEKPAYANFSSNALAARQT